MLSHIVQWYKEKNMMIYIYFPHTYEIITSLCHHCTKWNLSHNLTKLPSLILHRTRFNPLVQSPSTAEMFISPPRFYYFVQLSNTSSIYWFTSWHWTCCASTSKCQMTDSLWYVSIENVQYIPPKYSYMFVLCCFICTCEGEREREMAWK